jgi:hypothetical protein
LRAAVGATVRTALENLSASLGAPAAAPAPAARTPHPDPPPTQPASTAPTPQQATAAAAGGIGASRFRTDFEGATFVGEVRLDVVCVFVFVCLCVCVCGAYVCVCALMEGRGWRQGGFGQVLRVRPQAPTKTEREKERECVCVECEREPQAQKYAYTEKADPGDSRGRGRVQVRNKLDGRDYALKRIRLHPTDQRLNDRIVREVTVLSRLHHEHVVRYYNAWTETDTDGRAHRRTRHRCTG